jgi:hypothetical protein
MADLHVSQPMLIGKHEWRLRIFNHPTYGPCTTFEWRRAGSDGWNPQRQWPSYDINHTYLGVPRGLDRLYDREIDHVIRLIPEAAARHAMAKASAEQGSFL